MSARMGPDIYYRNYYGLTISSDEVYHYGIKGQIWGRRRYQNPDGSLTPEGRKRYGILSEMIEKHNKKVVADRTEEAERKKKVSLKERSVSDITDDELREYTNRLNLEKQYLQAKKDVDVLTPKNTSAGQKFVQATLNKVIAPAVAKSAEKTLETYLIRTGNAWVNDLLKAQGKTQNKGKK